jgi:hypothetical protein
MPLGLVLGPRDFIGHLLLANVDRDTIAKALASNRYSMVPKAQLSRMSAPGTQFGGLQQRREASSY